MANAQSLRERQRLPWTRNSDTERLHMVRKRLVSRQRVITDQIAGLERTLRQKQVQLTEESLELAAVEALIGSRHNVTVP